MTLRTRILLVYLLLLAGGCYYLLRWILDGIRPRYLESMEESLVDAANLLASTAQLHLTPDAQSLDLTQLRPALDATYRRVLDAQIYSLHKTRIDLRLTLTDALGIVIYDSENTDLGQDHSKWRNIRLTLAGQYGARGSKSDPTDDTSLSIFISAPIRSADRIIGTLTLGKPTASINALVHTARQRIILGGLIGFSLLALVGIVFSIWITTPIERLTAYARAIRDGKTAALPRLAGREVTDLRHAFEEMQSALEGKNYIEAYTQTLTHELKAPLTAIRGAAELIDDKMPSSDRAHFLGNIRRESARLQQILDRLQQLTSLEARARHGLEKVEPIDLAHLLREATATFTSAFHARRLRLDLQLPEKTVTVSGEKFLLLQAVTNLLQNAAEFSPSDSTLTVRLVAATDRVQIQIDDQGPGIPDYALSKIFDRFYSLPRPDTGNKSTGLGLSYVREIAHLHRGDVTLENIPPTGCRATLRLPV